MPSLSHTLPPSCIADVVAGYLREDCPTLDLQGAVVGGAPATALLLCKSPTTLAGVPFFDAVFTSLGCTVTWSVGEGAALAPPQAIATVTGPVNRLLLGERTALNILSRASGVAHGAAAAVAAAAATGWSGRVVGTRKTTPGFRLVEKYGLMVGGAGTHRMDLSGMVMLKDNHVWACGGVGACVRDARALAGFSTKVEVEARCLEEALEGAGAGADVVMLDNYGGGARLSADASALKSAHPHVLVEASGGVTLSTLPLFCVPGVDVVSMGCLTHGYAVADFSLKVQRGEGLGALARAGGAAAEK